LLQQFDFYFGFELTPVYNIIHAMVDV